MNPLTRSIAPLTVFALCLSRLVAADTVEIKNHWPVGKKLLQTMKMEQSSTMELGGQKMDQKANVTIDMSSSIAKHEDGKQKRMTVKYERMAMDMNMGPQKMTYDSAKPQEDALGIGKSIGTIIGKEFKVLANEKDEITGIENYDEIAAGLGAGGSPAGQMFGKDQMLEMMKQGALTSTPGKPVKVGDSWPLEISIKMPPLGTLTMKGTYTYKGSGPHDGVPSYEIAMDAKISVDAAGGGDSPLGLKITDGKTAGTIWFDPALGMARSSDMVTNMSMSMKNPAQPDAALTIPMTQRISQSVTKVEDVK